MSTHQEILAELVAASTEELTPERLAELSATAKTLASLGPAAPPVAPKAKVDPNAARDARIAELRAQTGKGNDRQRAERSAEMARLIHERHPTDEFGFQLPPDGDAA